MLEATAAGHPVGPQRTGGQPRAVRQKFPIIPDGTWRARIRPESCSASRRRARSDSTADSIHAVTQEPIPRRIRTGQTAESAAGSLNQEGNHGHRCDLQLSRRDHGAVRRGLPGAEQRAAAALAGGLAGWRLLSHVGRHDSPMVLSCSTSGSQPRSSRPSARR